MTDSPFGVSLPDCCPRCGSDRPTSFNVERGCDLNTHDRFHRLPIVFGVTPQPEGTECNAPSDEQGRARLLSSPRALAAARALSKPVEPPPVAGSEVA